MNRPGDNWARAFDKAHRILTALQGRARLYTDGHLAGQVLDAQWLEDWGIALDPAKAGQVESELAELLGRYGCLLEWTPDPVVRITWDGRYLVTSGAQSEHVIADNIPDASEVERVAEDADERPTHVWRSCDYYVRHEAQCGPIAVYEPDGGDR